MSSLSLGHTSAKGRTRDPYSALVVTVVHNPKDARIRQRQVNALLAAGWKVTYVAPFGGFSLDVPPSRPADLGQGNLHCLNIARSSGRRRLPAWRAARTMMRALAQDHDVVLVHDPELVLAATGLGMKNLIWDVHEDPAAALQVKSWMPKPLRRPLATAWRHAERIVEQRHHLLLAEYSYQARFRRRHPVVSNSVSVPRSVMPPGAERVSYLGTVTMSRGCETMIEVGRNCAAGPWSFQLDVIGEPPTLRRGRRYKRLQKPVMSARSVLCRAGRTSPSQLLVGRVVPAKGSAQLSSQSADQDHGVLRASGTRRHDTPAPCR